MSILIKTRTGHDLTVTTNFNSVVRMPVYLSESRKKKRLFSNIASVTNIIVNQKLGETTLAQYQLTDSNTEITLNDPKNGYIKFPLKASTFNLTQNELIYIYVSITGAFGTLDIKNEDNIEWVVLVRKV